MERVRYHVSGVANKAAKLIVKNSLDKIDGVQHVSIDMRQSTIEVEYNEPADEKQIRDCLNGAGQVIL